MAITRKLCLAAGLAVSLVVGVAVVSATRRRADTGPRTGRLSPAVPVTQNPAAAPPGATAASPTSLATQPTGGTPPDPAGGTPPDPAGPSTGRQVPAAAGPVSTGPPGVATALGAAPDCLYTPDNASTPREALTWTPGTPPGESQQVELTNEPHGLEHGHFTRSATLTSTDTGITWPGIKPGENYTWLVTTRRGKTTTASPPHAFVAQPCLEGSSGP